MNYIHIWPFKAEIRPEFKEDALKLSNEFIKWLTREFEVYCRHEPTIFEATEFGTQEKHCELGFRLTLKRKEAL